LISPRRSSHHGEQFGRRVVPLVNDTGIGHRHDVISTAVLTGPTSSVRILPLKPLGFGLPRFGCDARISQFSEQKSRFFTSAIRLSSDHSLMVEAVPTKLLQLAWRVLIIRWRRLRLTLCILRPCRRTSRNGTHARYGHGKIFEHACLPANDGSRGNLTTDCCSIAICAVCRVFPAVAGIIRGGCARWAVPDSGGLTGWLMGRRAGGCLLVWRAGCVHRGPVVQWNQRGHPSRQAGQSPPPNNLKARG
jgi:hypothetical protein